MCDSRLQAPWRVERCRRYTGLFDVYDHDGNPIIEWKIKEVAMLIAAAPDLLAALKYIVGWNRERGAWSPERARDLARAAIAKATAEEGVE